MIHFITGGARSGKSSYAQKLALRLSNEPVYIATSRMWDEDHKKRINRHKEDRDSRFILFEEEKYISRLKIENRTVVVDCITLWLVNFLSDNKYDFKKTLEETKSELKKIFQIDCSLIIVSNEIGMGVHAESEMARKFTDLQGWINQFIAENAGQVFLMVSGIPLKIK
jgi:adenosylcobinamide kinase / adenosylcobinamide-phosphate guanylyltransferase